MARKKRDAKLEAQFLFASTWNNVRAFPTYYDLERAFNKPFKKIRTEARAYTVYAAEHPDERLPPLAWRKEVTGGVIPIPEAILRQLDPWRIDTETVKKARGVVVTSAQFGAVLNTHVWRSLTHYTELNGYVLVVLPIKYGPVQIVDDVLTGTFPDELKERMLFEGLLVAQGELMLNPMRMRPTLQRFLTKRVCQVGGAVSQIFAAPRFELEHRPRVGRKYPKALMTSGTITHPTYAIDKLGQQDRTGELASEDHAFGAVVVEFGKKGMFHFRQLVSNKRGEFYDIDTNHGGARLYTPKGSEHRPDDVDTLVCGDWHTGKTDKTVRKVTFKLARGIVQTLKPKHICLHDFIDTDSVSKWEEKQATRRAFKGPLRWDSLEDELNQGLREMLWMRKYTDALLHVVPSNHNEYVTEYVESMRWAKDNANLAIGAQLFSVMVDDLKQRGHNQPKHEARAIDPVVWWLRTHAHESVRAHERQDDLIRPLGSKNGSLLTMHGDKGPGGKETRSTDAFRNMNINVVLGHNHSATIIGPVWRVGTSTPRMQFYVDQPATNWTNSHCVIYKNGQRQLINILKAKWHG